MSNKKPQIKQFKLSNGEEIICEVVQWDDEESAGIIIRAGMQLVENNNFKTGIKLYTFKPWLAFNENPSILQSLNSHHVIGETTPSIEMLKMYSSCLVKLKKFLKEHGSSTALDLDDLSDLTDEELHDVLEEEMERLAYDGGDSDLGSNVIKISKYLH